MLFFGVNIAIAQINVTSNADSGPGTLREALTAAATNGTVGVDVINFNLSGNAVSDRTIRLRSQLPAVTANVTIDGTSQAGASLGVSGAKVIIEPENSPATFSGLIIGGPSTNNVPTANVEIYGLYIRRFANITNLSSVNTAQGSGIVIDYRVQNIIIGKPNKGNVLCGNVSGILMRNTVFFTTTALSTITVQGNMIGVMDDGSSPFTNQYGISGDLSEYNVSIGGDNAGEGNVIAANGTDVLFSRSYTYSTLRSGLNIIGNKIGTDYTGQKDYKNLPIFTSNSSLEMFGIRVNATLTDVNIHKNNISGHRSWGVSIANSDFTITGNYIGTNADGTFDLGNNGGIRLETGSQGSIGGTATADVNLIGFNRFGVESVSAKPIKITRNSFFCNVVFGIGKTQTISQAYIQILKRQTDFLSGKASPNAEIEIFNTDQCAASCQGKTYVGAVRAGNDGRWSYSGPLNGQVTATATLLTSTTSAFADAGLLDNEAIVAPITCKGNGSITISEPREGISFKWFKLEADGTEGPMGETQSITNLAIGTYEVRIFDGCKTTTHKFFITDQVLTKPTIVPPIPSCGQTSFMFSASTVRGNGVLTYQWYNVLNINAPVSVGTQVTLPAGTYFVRVTDASGCFSDSERVTISARPTPVINTAGRSITPARCGFEDGGIAGIVVTPGKGTATYKWFKVSTIAGQNDLEVGSDIILKNVSGGNYYIVVYDESDCSPLQGPAINIPITNSVIFTVGRATSATCNGKNGSISNISITEANRYIWYDPAGGELARGAYSTGQLLEFTGLAAGTYRLYAENTVTGCNNQRTYTIDQILATNYVATETKIPATCGLNNGSITLNYSSVLPLKYTWKNSLGNTITGGTATTLNNLKPDTYTLWTYDINNCENFLGPFIVDNIRLLSIVPSTGATNDDGCGLKRGSVTGVTVIGGVPEYTYKWINAKDEAIQYTKDLVGVGAGEYRLVVTDKTTCGTATSGVFTIRDYTFEVAAPSVNDVRVCYVTDLMIAVNKPEEGTYQLFTNTIDKAPFMESGTGIFNFKVTKSQKYYIKRKLGNCESVFSTFNVEVTNDNIEIANTMTPNGDGMNDQWTIKGLPNYKDIVIQLYSRSGQLVYESRGGYDKPFIGSFRGSDLPAGVYYYHIDLKVDCKPIAGSLTLLR